MVLDRVNAGNRGLGSATTGGVGMHSKRIQAGLSTQIVIEVVEGGINYSIGAIQSLAVTETRPTAKIVEVGTDSLIGIVPSAAPTVSIEVSRMVFDFQRLPQALQREYRHISNQRRPFDIVVTDYNPYLSSAKTPTGGDTGSTGATNEGGGALVVDTGSGSLTVDPTAVVTTFRNCWFENMSYTYEAATYTITERATLACERVFDNVDVNTIAGPIDALERNSNKANNGSIMSAYDAVRTP